MQTFAFEPVLTKLRQSVYPSVEGYWRAEAAITDFLDTALPSPRTGPLPCGPAALGAFFGDTQAATVTADVEAPWLNRRDMESCLKRLGAKFRKHQGRIPPQGVVLLERISLPVKRSYRGSFLTETHWVAVIDDYIFDTNWPQWLPVAHWKSLVGEPLARMNDAHAWRVVTGYEIIPGSGSRQQGRLDRATIGSQSMSGE